MSSLALKGLTAETIAHEMGHNVLFGHARACLLYNTVDDYQPTARPNITFMNEERNRCIDNQYEYGGTFFCP